MFEIGKFREQKTAEEDWERVKENFKKIGIGRKKNSHYYDEWAGGWRLGEKEPSAQLPISSFFFSAPILLYFHENSYRCAHTHTPYILTVGVFIV